MTWQPIETAPMDGTWILLTGGKAGFDDYMGEIDAWPSVVSAHWREREWGYDGYWAMSYWDGAWRMAYEDPTHWMPIPKPPE